MFPQPTPSRFHPQLPTTVSMAKSFGLKHFVLSGFEGGPLLQCDGMGYAMKVLNPCKGTTIYNTSNTYNAAPAQYCKGGKSQDEEWGSPWGPTPYPSSNKVWTAQDKAQEVHIQYGAKNVTRQQPEPTSDWEAARQCTSTGLLLLPRNLPGSSRTAYRARLIPIQLCRIQSKSFQIHARCIQHMIAHPVQVQPNPGKCKKLMFIPSSPSSIHCEY